jgi:hypothetical protein
MHMIVVTKNTSHDLRISRINFSINIYIKKNLTNCIPILFFPFFPLSMQCLKHSFHAQRNVFKKILYYVTIQFATICN